MSKRDLASIPTFIFGVSYVGLVIAACWDLRYLALAWVVLLLHLSYEGLLRPRLTGEPSRFHAAIYSVFHFDLKDLRLVVVFVGAAFIAQQIIDRL